MFNPNASWDRPLPQEEALPGEPVEVITCFKEKRFYPECFFFSDRKHVIVKTAFIWKEKKGRELFYLFRVVDSQKGEYTLCFSKERLRWRIISE